MDGITFDIRRGETLGLVGESGCGKTTAGRTILGLYPMTDGSVIISGISLEQCGQSAYQTPAAQGADDLPGSLRFAQPPLDGERHHRRAAARASTCWQMIKRATERVHELMLLVGLSPRLINRFPHEFSGGQRQRIGVARALASNPEFIVCDEPISALDVSIQAQVVNLLEDLQDEFSLTYLFIAHDLSMVRHICDRVAVMYLGVMVELAERDELYENPLHPYTQALLSAVPDPRPQDKTAQRQRIILPGDVPSPINPPSGCRFHPRCPIAKEHCSVEVPVWREISTDHWVACHEVK